MNDMLSRDQYLEVKKKYDKEEERYEKEMKVLESGISREQDMIKNVAERIEGSVK